MSYRNLITSEDVHITTHSPRPSGQNAAYSEWKEVEYSVIENLSVAERAHYINKLSIFFDVHIKTATRGGRMRIFLK